MEQIELAAGTAKHEAVAERVRRADGMQTGKNVNKAHPQLIDDATTLTIWLPYQ